MAATVFYLDEVPAPGAVAVLDGPEGRHAATVRRIRVGEPITLSDGRGVLAESEVVAAHRAPAWAVRRGGGRRAVTGIGEGGTP